jgi:hypothetical protein
VHSLAHEIRIYEDGELLAVHPVLEGRRRTSLLPGHRRSHHRHEPGSQNVVSPSPVVCRRPLSFYDRVARRLAGVGRSA